MGISNNRQAVATAAADIYHNHFEEVHKACEEFQKVNNLESLNKIMHLLGHLHSVGGAPYQYSQDADYPQIWLMSNGKTILNQLITDAQAARLEDTAKSLSVMCGKLEQSNIVQ